MAKYRVTQTIQSKDNDPVTVPYQKIGDEAETTAAVANLLVNSRPNPDDDFPGYRAKLLSISINLVED